MRLTKQMLRTRSAEVGRFADVKIRAADGRLVHAMTRLRISVVQCVIDLVGWRGMEHISLATIAKASGQTVDTVVRALRDARAKGWLDWKPRFTTGPDGRRRSLPSKFWLLAPEPQNADGLSSIIDSSLSFLCARRRQEAEARAEARKVAREAITFSLSDEGRARVAQWGAWHAENPPDHRVAMGNT